MDKRMFMNRMAAVLDVELTGDTGSDYHWIWDRCVNVAYNAYFQELRDVLERVNVCAEMLGLSGWEVRELPLPPEKHWKSSPDEAVRIAAD